MNNNESKTLLLTKISNNNVFVVSKKIKYYVFGYWLIKKNKNLSHQDLLTKHPLFNNSIVASLTIGNVT